MENVKEYAEKVYAGVLGKIIGVFYGRPVEGWPYEKIKNEFGLVDHYVNREVGVPLHVGDDDLAGTFTFLNAAEDFAGNPKDLRAEDFGKAWLDYVMENRTIFWWGGLGRSTEHTAYLRLKAGIPAPQSGSMQTNGQGVAEQIGAQIFMDAYPLMCPNDPERARYLVKQCASVSHDGIAVESACLLAAMEALAFGERDICRLLEQGTSFSSDARLLQIVDSVRNEVEKTRDFREVRDWLEEKYSYRFFPGNCHVIPNLALIVACLLLGGDSFTRAMQFCVSAGWDTDCNGANLGCLNGIRLGLSSMREGFDFRTPVADRFYNISANGGGCVTDAVRETERILRQHDRMYEDKTWQKRPRFSFFLPGSVQGFDWEREPGQQEPRERLANQNEGKAGDFGLVIPVTDDKETRISTLTLWDTADISGGYQLIGSPILYSTQTVEYVCEAVGAEVRVRPFVVFYDFDDREQMFFGEEQKIEKKSTFRWKIPENHGYMIKRVGLAAQACTGSGSLLLRSLDWDGAPEQFRMNGSLRNYDLGAANMQIRAFTASAEQFSFDARRTFTVSHTEKNGLAVIGTDAWKDYSVECTLTPGLQERCGLVGRVRGLRRYYALVFTGENRLQLLVRCGEKEQVLASAEFPWQMDVDYRVKLWMKGKKICGFVDGIERLSAEDETFSQGGGGFLVDYGTCMADDLLIRRIVTTDQ